MYICTLIHTNIHEYVYICVQHTCTHTHTHTHTQCTGDQMVLYYGFSHKSMKWWKRVFYHLLDMALVNAHILYLMSGNRLTQLEFRQEVAKGLLEGFQRQREHTTPKAPDIPLRLTESRPFLEPTPSGTRPDCRVCSDRKAGERHQTARAVKHPCVLIPAWSNFTHSKTIK